MKIILFIFSVLFACNTYSQWTYSSGKTDFDGSYKTSSVRGSGGEFPYKNPSLVVNRFNKESINVYISGAGYSGCEGKKVYFKFDSEETIYETQYVSTDRNNELWFVDDLKDLKLYDFIEKLKENSTLSVRLISNCNQSDYKFSLRGSTRALNFVLGKNWVETQRDSIKNFNKLKRIKDSLEKVNQKLKLDSIQKSKKIKDSILKIKNLKLKKDKYDLFVSKCRKYSEYVKDLNTSCKMTIKGTLVRKVMHHLDNQIDLKKERVVFIDLDFKNRAFYKIKFIEDLGKVNYYTYKKNITEPTNF